MKKVFALTLTILLLLSAFTFVPFADDDETELPKAVTLMGTEDLPPISNQGSVGCCGSSSITYMQFTNAVSRYLRTNYPEMAINPSSGEFSEIFSPKWTYDFGGSGTAWVYNVLMEHGALTMDKTMFGVKKLPNEKPYRVDDPKKPNAFLESAVRWDISEGQMEEALNIRLKNFEQIWIRKNTFSNENGKINLTQTEVGKNLLEKIKAAVNEGNVVVTGGFSSSWTYVDQITGKGTLAQSFAETALVCGRGSMSGGHQLAIVGYDDEITCRYQGQTLKGAFQVANSWGTGWGNDGCVWLMYDALNEESEFAELNFSDRVYPIDQFCFVDWKTDIEVGLPSLYVEIEVSAKDREAVSAMLTTKSADNKVKSYIPYLFKNSKYHGKYQLDGLNYIYMTFDGTTDGDASKAIFSLDYRDLLDAETVATDQFGVTITTKEEGVILHSLKLKNNKGEVIAEVALSEEGQTLQSSTSLWFDKSLCNVTIPASDGSTGLQMEEVNALYAKDSEITLDYTLIEGYTDENMKVTISDGTKETEIQRSADGVFRIPVKSSLTVKVEGVEQAAEPTPTPTPTPTQTPTISPTPTPDSTPASTEASSSSSVQTPGEEDKGVSPVIFIVLGAAVAIGVAVAVVLAVKKKKK